MRKQAVLIFSSVVVQRLSMLVMTVLAARLIGAAELGKFAITYATCVTLTSFVGDALAATLNRHVASASDQPPSIRYERGGMVLSFCVALVLGLALLIALGSPWISRWISGSSELAPYIVISAVMTLALLPNTVMNAFLNALGRNRTAATVATAGAVSSVAMGLLGAYGWGAFGMCIGFAAGSLLLSGLYFAVLQRVSSVSLISLAQVRQYLSSGLLPSFTVPTLATMALGGPVHWLCMSFVGSSPSGVQQIAVFTAVYQWYSILTFVPSALMNFTVPWLTRSKLQGEAAFRQRALQILVLMSVGVGTLMAGIIFFNSTILSLYGPDFMAEESVLIVLAASGFLAALITVMNQIAWAAGASWSNLLAAWIYGLTYVTTAFVLIKGWQLGGRGLAWGIFIASLVQCLLQVYFFMHQRKLLSMPHHE
jgi:O-antigen/teichoic acid export membrane protein